VERRWYPIGRLTYDGYRYQYVYLVGAREAQNRYQFEPLASFPSLNKVYESDSLFPLFSNRVLSNSRSDYKDFVEWLNIPKDEDDPIAILSRSGGRRVTDNLEVFPCPQPDELDRYHIHFFAHGLSYLPKESINRINDLKPEDSLLLAWDFQNPHDPLAIMLRTNDTYEGDRYIVGYCPRYLLPDAYDIMNKCPDPPRVTVERINPPPAPLQLRLLCNMTTCWPEDFKPCSNEMYQPIPSNVSV
jgi:hypothetical protein